MGGPGVNAPFDQERPCILRVSRVVLRCTTLGPGLRSVVWTQGCGLRCRGCLVPDTHDPAGGQPVDVEALAAALLADPAPTGLTLSGGEPFDQAAACADLVEHVRAARPDLSAMAYSGHRLERLRARPDAARLLRHLDLLVDGAYVERLHAPLRWRGSANQRIHLLSERHADLADAPDVTQGVEIGVSEHGTPFINGVPPFRDARTELERLLEDRSPDPEEGETEDERH